MEWIDRVMIVVMISGLMFGVVGIGGLWFLPYDKYYGEGDVVVMKGLLVLMYGLIVLQFRKLI